MWVSGLNSTGVVQWGTSSGQYSWNATTTPYTYSQDQVSILIAHCFNADIELAQICGDWAFTFFRDPGYVWLLLVFRV